MLSGPLFRLLQHLSELFWRYGSFGGNRENMTGKRERKERENQISKGNYGILSMVIFAVLKDNYWDNFVRKQNYGN